MAEHAARTVAPGGRKHTGDSLSRAKTMSTATAENINHIPVIHPSFFIHFLKSRAGRQDQGVLGKKKNFIHRSHRDISGRGRR